MITMQTPKLACWLARKIFDARYWYMDKDLTVELQQCTTNDGFNIKKAYVFLCPQYQKVPWNHLTMGSNLIPRHQFIL